MDSEAYDTSHPNLLTQGGEYGNALYAASWGGHEKIVQMLIEGGADVKSLREFNGNVSHYR
jgi:hypothetical protein